MRCCHNAPCLPALCATGAALPGTAASAILVPASARLQQIQREKSAALQLQAETRKNMRRHFSVHNISFIAPAPAPGLCSVRGCVCMTSLILASSGVSSLTPGAGLCWYSLPSFKQGCHQAITLALNKPRRLHHFAVQGTVSPLLFHPHLIFLIVGSCNDTSSCHHVSLSVNSLGLLIKF